MRTLLLSCLTLITLSLTSFAAEPPENELVWQNGKTVKWIHAGDYNSSSGQGLAYVTTVLQDDGNGENRFYQFNFPLNVEWGQIAYSIALAAYLNGKKINVLCHDDGIENPDVGIRHFTAYRIAICDE